MDEAVIKYYRKLLKTGFEHSGSNENAAIFLDTTTERLLICGNTGDFMQLYVNIADNKIVDIKYTCVCDPTANVAVEILCTLVKDKTLEEAVTVKEEALYQLLGSNSEELQKKVRGMVELLKRGIIRYQTTAR
jgi:NifU-like protein involved in Fe-S cluster formation